MYNFTGLATFILRQAQEVGNPCEDFIYLVFENRKLKFV
jgi:hypothetical protein